MKLKANMLGVVAALGLTLSLVGPARAADYTDTAPVVVTLSEGGYFAVDLEGTTLLPSSPVTSYSTNVTATGFIVIQYFDTYSYRPGFDVTLRADDFTSTKAKPAGAGGGFYGIDSDNLYGTQNWNPAQCNWSSRPGNSYRIGDIGNTTNGQDTDHNDAEDPFWPWHTQPDATTRLGSTQYVAWGYAGAGTAGGVCTGDLATTPSTLQQLDLMLRVPNGAPATTYTSILHVDVTWNNSIP